jgi:hypothetical protein
MKELFDEHEKNADEISEIAKERGIELKTEIQLSTKGLVLDMLIKISETKSCSKFSLFNLFHSSQGLSVTGFKVCMFMLIVSAISAFFAKGRALRCQIQTDIIQKLKNNMKDKKNQHIKKQ